MVRRLQTCVIAPLLLLAACGSDDGSQTPTSTTPDEVEVVPFASTKMLTTADLASLQPDREDGRLVFDRAPAILADVAVGTVMVAGISPATPHGFMRVVTDVQRAGEVLTLQTQGAQPQLAFRKLHARLSRPVSLDDAEPVASSTIEPLITGTSKRKQPVNVVLFDGDGDTATTEDQLRIEGEFSGALTYDLSIDIDWGAIDRLPDVVTSCVASVAKILRGRKPDCSLEALIPEVKVKFAVDPSVASNLRLVGQASLGFEKEFDVAVVPLTPLVLGPLVFLPRLEIIAKVEGGASASFRAGVAGSMTLTSSVTVSSKAAGQPQYSPPAIKDKSFTVEQPEVGLHAQAQVNAGVRLNMPLYGTVGPYATAEATLKIEADPSKTPCWTLRAGLESVIGAKITTPSLPLLGHVELVDWKTSPFKAIDEVVASGTCKDPPPGASRLPPGSGPDAPALRDPLFTPWAHVEDGTLDTTAAAGPEQTGIVFSDVTRHIDGRWLIAGSDARTLVKMDDTGLPVWRASYVTDAETPLAVVRTVPRRDASIVALASGAVGSSFTLLNLGQSGAVRSAQSYALPLDLCAAPAARVLTPDAASGMLVMGECLSQSKAFVVHVDRAGNVVESRLWSLEGGSGSFGPTALTRTTTSQLVLAGVLTTPSDGDGMFVARLDEAANAVTFDGYVACPTSFNLSPTALVAGPSNTLTVAGGSHAQSRAFVARLQENGDVGFVTYPGFVEGNAPIFVASAIAELPTTGFLMTASTVELTGDGGANVPGVALVSLDAQGKTVWSQRYALAGHSSSFPSLRLTTDGGAFIASFATPTGSATGATWAMKAFAKDGTVTSARVTNAPLPLDDGPTDCAVKRIAVTPKVEPVPVDTAPLVVTRR